MPLTGRTHTTYWIGGMRLGFSGSIIDISMSSFQVGLFVCFRILLWHSWPPTLTTTYGSLKPDLSAEGSSLAAYKNVLRMNSCNFGIETADRWGMPPDLSPAKHFSINIPHNVPFLYCGEDISGVISNHLASGWLAAILNGIMTYLQRVERWSGKELMLKASCTRAQTSLQKLTQLGFLKLFLQRTLRWGHLDLKMCP